MTIEELYYSEDISIRSINLCRYNDLNNLSSILKHYHKYGTFDNLRNCGKKSNNELTTLCLKYIDYENYHYSENLISEKQPVTTIINFTRTQREVVNNFIEINTNNLSNRSKNALISFLDGNLKIRNISERILTNDNFNFRDIKNVGTKTVTELNSFFESIIAFIEKVKEVENEKDLITLRNRFFIEKTFSISIISSEIVETQSIFNIVNFLIKEAIFEKNERTIFQKGLKIYENQPDVSLDQIAKELNISRERVRQIRKFILENICSTFNFTRNIEDDLFQKYDIDKNLINVDDYLNSLINRVNKTNFSNNFITFLIYTYASEKFDLIGEIEDVLLPKSFNTKGRYKWNNFYLVSQELNKLFCFNDFVNDVEQRLKDRIEDTYYFNFKSYLTNFIKMEDNTTALLVFPVAEKIINAEFNLSIDVYDNIIFKRNTVRQVPDYAIEALEKLGVPSKIEDIYKQIVEVDPEITKNQEALRGSLQRTPEIIYFGRSSTYGLKKWEIEIEGVRGGTIKDIILEYLQAKTDPIHILELLNEVHKYREKTSAKNIITNLKRDPQKQFIIFNQSFIGLSDKSYNSKLSNLPKFLGKTITRYLKQNNKVNKLYVEELFSKQLSISIENTKYIIEHLIENNSIQIDNQNHLTV